MFLLWLSLFVILAIGGLIIYKKAWNDEFIFLGGFTALIASGISIVMIVYVIDDHFDIKNEMIKIRVLQETINSEHLLELKDTIAIKNLDPNVLLEKKLEYNEKIITWQNDNKWWKSGIYIPNEVDTLKLIK